MTWLLVVGSSLLSCLNFGINNRRWFSSVSFLLTLLLCCSVLALHVLIIVLLQNYRKTMKTAVKHCYKDWIHQMFFFAEIEIS